MADPAAVAVDVAADAGVAPVLDSAAVEVARVAQLVEVSDLGHAVVCVLGKRCASCCCLLPLVMHPAPRPIAQEVEEVLRVVVQELES